MKVKKKQNVILKQDITTENCISFTGMDQGCHVR